MQPEFIQAVFTYKVSWCICVQHDTCTAPFHWFRLLLQFCLHRPDYIPPLRAPSHFFSRTTTNPPSSSNDKNNIEQPVIGACGEMCIQPWGMGNPNYCCNWCDNSMHLLCAAIYAQKASEGQFEDPDSVQICHTCMVLPGELANHFGLIGKHPPPAKRAQKDDGGTAENGDETRETVERLARLEWPSNYTLCRWFGLDCVDQTSWKYQGVDKSTQSHSSTILQKDHLVADLSHLEHGRLW
jgi:hypothetical protein